MKLSDLFDVEYPKTLVFSERTIKEGGILRIKIMASL